MTLVSWAPFGDRLKKKVTAMQLILTFVSFLFYFSPAAPLFFVFILLWFWSIFPWRHGLLFRDFDFYSTVGAVFALRMEDK